MSDLLPPPPARIPDPTGHFETLPPGDQAYMRELVASLQREINTQRTTALPHVLLLAPDSSVWRVTVNNTGVLAAAKVSMARGVGGILP